MRKKEHIAKIEKSQIEELDKIYSFLGLDYKTSGMEYNPFLITDRIIRGEIMLHYAFINLFLDVCILRYFYPSKSDKHYIRKRYDKYKRFVDYFLQELPFLKKIKLLKSLIKIPKGINRDLERINALRNTISHGGIKEIFPSYEVRYKGKKILTFEGIKLFYGDSDRIQTFLQKFSPIK